MTISNGGYIKKMENVTKNYRCNICMEVLQTAMARKKKKVDAAIIPVAAEKMGPELLSMGTHTGILGEYELFGVADDEGNPQPLVVTDTFMLAVVRHPSGQLGFAKVAANEEARAALDKEARILRTLQQVAKRVDEVEEAKGNIPPFYGAFIPVVAEVIDDEKFVLLLGYHPSIASFQQLKPLSLITDGARIDLKSATWLMGKAMKTLDFVHSLGFAVGRLDNSNILLETEVHGLVIFDWTDAIEEASLGEQRTDVTNLAYVIWNATGGTDDTPPIHDEALLNIVMHAEYCSVLGRIKAGDTEGARAEYDLIYQVDEGLADRCWPRREKTEGTVTILKRDFHPFAIYPLL